MSRLLPTSLLIRSLVLGGVIFAAVSSPSIAQGRGRGGGGGGGGRGAGGGGGASFSPMDRVKDELKATDELEFLHNRNKQLSLDKEQKDAIKALNKEMDQMQKPIFKEMEKTFADAERSSSMGGGGSRGGGEAGMRGGRGAMPAGIRESMVKLTEIQAAFAERAAVLLRDDQKHLADSLRVIYKNDLRDKAARNARSRGAGGFGGGRGG